MIPNGPIYSKIREDLLTTFPLGTNSNIKKRITFSKWLGGSGSYHIKSISKDEIIFSAPIIEISSSILTDIELLSNHCFEHIQEIFRFHNDNQKRSDAWNIVTIYYFAFFNAQLFTRLIGNPTLFIKKEQIDYFKKITTGNVTGIGVGSYSLKKIQNISANNAEFQLKKTNNQKIHEATWIKLFSYFDEILKTKSLLVDANEVLFYKLLATKELTKVYDLGWPSQIRTAANYSPGFAYLELENSSAGKTKKLLNKWRNIEYQKIIPLLRTSVESCCPAEKTDFSAHVNLLHDVSQILFILSRTLYSELLQRNNIDKRHEMSRSTYRKKMTYSLSEFPLIGRVY